MSARRFSPKIKAKASTLSRLIDDPAYAGQMWTWDKIGAVLALNPREAREVIYYLRDHATGFVWTVGTRSSGWETMPTTSGRDALDGEINQNRHLITRINSREHACTVLSKVDPEPRMARVFGRPAKMFHRMADEVSDVIEYLIEIRDEVPPAAPVMKVV